MKKQILLILTLLACIPVFADDFVTTFMNAHVEEKRPVNNVNIGKTMLGKMAENAEDHELKETLEKLNSIRIITTENKRDAKYYFKKAEKLAEEQFSDFNEVTSINERKSKVQVLLKNLENDLQELILIALDDNCKLTIITVSGKIDFKSFSKLSELLNSETLSTETGKQSRETTETE